MHELSLSSAVLETALRHADGRRVKSVQMRIGTMRQVVPDSLEFYFGIVTRGTLCEGAILEQEQIEALLRCEECRREWSPQLPMFRCPGCGGGEVSQLAGDEFEIDSIVVEEVEENAAKQGEEEDRSCIAPR